MPQLLSNSPKQESNRISECLVMLRDAVNMASHLEEKLDAIAQSFVDLSKEKGFSPAILAKNSHATPHARSETHNEELKRKANEGVSAATIYHEPNGKKALKIEGGNKIYLTPRLAVLAEILGENTSSPDAHVGWKKDVDVMIVLERHLGKPYKKHTYNHLIHLLRNALEAHGENRWLVMRDSKLGSRLAVSPPGIVTSIGHN